ncbi:hypothetical protein HZA40_00755 [Candidatus Peregrinibacteria bacterium]|nr:hypothetical protein [Candidatus Peregrinibacteria bacterium]
MAEFEGLDGEEFTTDRVYVCPDDGQDFDPQRIGFGKARRPSKDKLVNDDLPGDYFVDFHSIDDGTVAVRADVCDLFDGHFAHDPSVVMRESEVRARVSGVSDDLLDADSFHVVGDGHFRQSRQSTHIQGTVKTFDELLERTLGQSMRRRPASVTSRGTFDTQVRR